MSEPSSTVADGIEVQSFRVVFRLERRLHKIQRWRIPVPYGIPLVSIAYAVVVLAVIVMAGALPLVGALVGAIPAPVRFVVAPIAFGGLLSRLQPDGRAAHHHLLARLRYRIGPRHVSAFRRIVPPGRELRIADVITFIPDPSATRYRPAVIRGTGRVLLRYPASAQVRGRTLRITPRDGAPMWRGHKIGLQGAQRIVVAKGGAS